MAPNVPAVIKNTLVILVPVYAKNIDDKDKVPRPTHWSGWNLSPSSIEFWLDGDSRIHERLKYTKDSNGNWIQSLLSP